MRLVKAHESWPGHPWLSKKKKKKENLLTYSSISYSTMYQLGKIFIVMFFPSFLVAWPYFLECIYVFILISLILD